MKGSPRAGAIVLAAGGSSRMGQAKQLLPLGGHVMVRSVTEVVCSAGLDQVIVVVGAHAKAVEQALSGLPIEIVLNCEWPQGLSTSVRAGIGALRPDIEVALMVLADQPGLCPSLLHTLLACYRRSGALIVAPFFEGRRGNPVLFDRALFPELLATEGDQGGRAVIERHWEQMEPVHVDSPSILVDVDTPQDYVAARQQTDLP